MPSRSPRRVAILAWTFGVLGGLLLFIWIASIFCAVGCMLPGGRLLAVHAGYVAVGQVAEDSASGHRRLWLIEHDPEEFYWWFSAPSNSTEWSVRAPLWLPSLLCLAVAALGWRTAELARRRSRTGTTPRSTPNFLRAWPRLRLLVKWGLAAATALSLLAFFASGRWGIAYLGAGGSGVTLFHGQMLITRTDGNVPTSTRRSSAQSPPAPPHSGLRFGHPQRYGIIWGFSFHRNPYGWICSVPLWLVCLLALSATSIPWLRDAIGAHRARAGLCRTCRYDRAGLPPEAVCPECGSPP